MPFRDWDWCGARPQASLNTLLILPFGLYLLFLFPCFNGSVLIDVILLTSTNNLWAWLVIASIHILDLNVVELILTDLVEFIHVKGSSFSIASLSFLLVSAAVAWVFIQGQYIFLLLIGHMCVTLRFYNWLMIFVIIHLRSFHLYCLLGLKFIMFK